MASLPLILAFDTSAAHCAAAVISGDSVLAEMHEPMLKGQAERLVPMLQDCLAQSGAAWDQLTALGVGTGPGNFTGTRIAVSTARGIALARGIPARGVSTFDALAFGLQAPLLVSIDARQGRMYLRRYLNEAEQPFISALDALPDDISVAGMKVCGDFAEELSARTGATVVQSPVSLSVAIARIAAARTSDTSRPAPLYLRPADAAPARDLPPVILA